MNTSILHIVIKENQDPAVMNQLTMSQARKLVGEGFDMEQLAELQMNIVDAVDAHVAHMQEKGAPEILPLQREALLIEMSLMLGMMLAQ